jgi:hypothetical protein
MVRKLEGSAKQKRIQAKKNFDASIEKFKNRLGITTNNTSKTSVVKNTVGKMSPDDKVGPSHLGRANPLPLDTSGSLKVTPAKNVISRQTEVPSIHKSNPKPSSTSTKPLVRTTSPDQGGLKVSNKEVVTGSLNKPSDTNVSSDRMSWAREAERMARKMMGGKD